MLRRNKKGVSSIVALVVVMALVLILGAVIITTTEETVEDKTEQAQSCGQELIGTISLNSEWSCYDKQKEILNVQVERKKVELDKLTISASTGKSSYQFKLNKNLSNPKDGDKKLYPFNSTGQLKGQAKLLEKDSAKNYMISNFTEKPESIEIAPIVKGNQCRVSETITNIPNCFEIGIF